MITLFKSGYYKLIETKHQTKILYLDKNEYAWIEPSYLGEMLVITHKIHKSDCVLALGQYRIYEVVGEAGISDHIHLELEVGDKAWQGYLLLTGLPDKHKPRARIVPTHEVISDNPRFHGRQGVRTVMQKSLEMGMK